MRKISGNIFKLFLFGSIITIGFYLAFNTNTSNALLYVGASFFISTFIISFISIKEKTFEKTFLSIVLSCILLAVSMFIFESIFMTPIKRKSVALDEKNQIIQIFPEETCVWHNDPILNKNNSILLYSEKVVKIKFSDIDRNILYYLELKSGGTPEKIAMQKEEIPDDEIGEWINGLLVEFNQQKQSGNSEINNPYKQKGQLRELIKKFLMPHLEKAGIDLIEIKFKVRC